MERSVNADIESESLIHMLLWHSKLGPTLYRDQCLYKRYGSGNKKIEKTRKSFPLSSKLILTLDGLTVENEVWSSCAYRLSASTTRSIYHRNDKIMTATEVTVGRRKVVILNSTNKESKKPDVVEGKRHRHQDRPQRKSTLNKEEETL
ncbi:hypothetical protein M513_00014 [Trichuris suis]|uniref:Uncharacterized protein n=1 Tax=Trichuris suis TaxID=68888 RepID=A0A085MNQ5_9BILA|nr:hypothetical protein M513_00014 [Trichuris suis]